VECIEEIGVPFCIIIWVQGGKIDAKVMDFHFSINNNVNQEPTENKQ
jgi:hypothetical protein